MGQPLVQCMNPPSNDRNPGEGVQGLHPEEVHLSQDTELLRISEVAERLYVHPGSIRRAERVGRVPRAQREAVSGYRYYSPEDVAALRARFRR